MAWSAHVEAGGARPASGVHTGGRRPAMAVGPHAPTPLALGSEEFQLTLGEKDWTGTGRPPEEGYAIDKTLPPQAIVGGCGGSRTSLSVASGCSDGMSPNWRLSMAARTSETAAAAAPTRLSGLARRRVQTAALERRMC